MDKMGEAASKDKVSEYDYIRLCVCDMLGVSRCKVIPSRNASGFISKGLQVGISKFFNVYI